jgi:DNA mismatch endonuclease, patch repair protein
MAKTVYLRDGRSPIPKNETISRVMRANKGKNTSLEVLFRRNLRRVGLKDYKLHPKRLAGRPDVVFPKQRVAVFINGCFWHRCPSCNLKLPKTNTTFWRKKFNTNVDRDKRTINLLRKTGWHVATVWECQLKKNIAGPTAKVVRLHS